MEGTTLVVSPLLALQADMCSDLERRGIKATAINCTLLFKFTTAIRLCSFTFNRLNPAITPNTIINVSTKKFTP